MHVDITGDEINVAIDINRGRALALTPFRSPYDEPPPTVDPDFSVTTASGGRLEEPEANSDSIADLLQAGKFAGWNPEDLCRRALSLRARVELEGQMGATDARGHANRRYGAFEHAGTRCVDPTMPDDGPEVDGGTFAEVSPPRALAVDTRDKDARQGKDKCRSNVHGNRCRVFKDNRRELRHANLLTQARVLDKIEEEEERGNEGIATR